MKGLIYIMKSNATKSNKDNHANQKNPNSKANKAGRDNRSNQKNPNN
jgi:hypothetical protein